MKASPVVIPYHPRPAQALIHPQLEAHRFCVLVTHRQLGKTVCAVNHLLKKALQNDIKFIFEEAENRGFDKKALKEVLKRRKMDENDARELDFSVDVYKQALGMD